MKKSNLILTLDPIFNLKTHKVRFIYIIINFVETF